MLLVLLVLLMLLVLRLGSPCVSVIEQKWRRRNFFGETVAQNSDPMQKRRRRLLGRLAWGYLEIPAPCGGGGDNSFQRVTQ